MACLGLSPVRAATPRLLLAPTSFPCPMSSRLIRASYLRYNIGSKATCKRPYFKSRTCLQDQPYPTYFNPPLQPPPPPKPRFFWRFVRGTALFTLGVIIGSAMSVFTISFATLFGVVKRGTRDTFEGAQDIEDALFANPLVKQLLDDRSYVMSRPNKSFPEAMRKNSLTANTLMGPGKFEIPALVFTKPDGSDAIAMYYLGGQMCGWPTYVHGGLIATLLDEGLARTCFQVLPNKIGMTAMLKIDYRSPCRANQFVVLRSRTTKQEGRKAWVKGELYELTGTGKNGMLIAEGDALFVEPRGVLKMLGPINEQLVKINEVER